jgi:hypothetical protein
MGPSSDIINHVAASGTQKTKTERGVRLVTAHDNQMRARVTLAQIARLGQYGASLLDGRRRMREHVRAGVLAMIVGLAGCASAGGPAMTVNGMGIAGIWSFDVLLERSFRGTVTFTGDDRFTVRCIDDLGRPDPPERLTRGSGGLEFEGCGARFRVHVDDTGALVADVGVTIQEPYTAQGPCVRTQTNPDGTVRCVQFEDVIRYRTRQSRGRVELQPIG